MANTENEFQELLDSGVHFGHLKRKWNPSMAPYIFDEKNGVHVIDLNKTQAKLAQAREMLKQLARSGKKILFVATKKQAKNILEEKIKPTGMPYVTERWPGGMLTNFATIRRAIRKMNNIDKNFADGTYDNLSKRERLAFSRERDKLNKQLGSVSNLTRLPAAIFVVDMNKERIAVGEARKLNIPTFAMVDTNSDPNMVDYPIPSNDDATSSIAKILDLVVEPINEGLEEREADKKAQNEKKKKKEEAKKKEESNDKKEGKEAQDTPSTEGETKASSTDSSE